MIDLATNPFEREIQSAVVCFDLPFENASVTRFALQNRRISCRKIVILGVTYQRSFRVTVGIITLHEEITITDRTANQFEKERVIQLKIGQAYLSTIMVMRASRSLGNMFFDKSSGSMQKTFTTNFSVPGIRLNPRRLR